MAICVHLDFILQTYNGVSIFDFKSMSNFILTSQYDDEVNLSIDKSDNLCGFGFYFGKDNI